MVRRWIICVRTTGWNLSSFDIQAHGVREFEIRPENSVNVRAPTCLVSLRGLHGNRRLTNESTHREESHSTKITSGTSQVLAHRPLRGANYDTLNPSFSLDWQRNPMDLLRHSPSLNKAMAEVVNKINFVSTCFTTCLLIRRCVYIPA